MYESRCPLFCVDLWLFKLLEAVAANTCIASEVLLLYLALFRRYLTVLLRCISLLPNSQSVISGDHTQRSTLDATVWIEAFFVDGTIRTRQTRLSKSCILSIPQQVCSPLVSPGTWKIQTLGHTASAIQQL